MEVPHANAYKMYIKYVKINATKLYAIVRADFFPAAFVRDVMNTTCAQCDEKSAKSLNPQSSSFLQAEKHDQLYRLFILIFSSTPQKAQAGHKTEKTRGTL